jgi:hypothetical protein
MKNNTMSKSKKTPILKYGIEITKPHSKIMYDHNDQCAQEMKKNILKAWNTELDKFNMDDEWPTGSKIDNIIDIQSNVCAVGYGDGYTIKDVNKDFLQELDTMANWQLHENYSYMCFKGLVPRTVFMMVGFDWQKCEYDGRIVANSELTSDFAELEPGHPMYVEVPCSAELDIQMANESENIQ